MSLIRLFSSLFCGLLALATLPVCAAAAVEPPATGELCWLSRLEGALAHYRLLAAQGGWPPVPAGPVLREGVRDERIPLLRERLVASADLAASAGGREAAFDGTLKEAVQRFQRRHGLAADGQVGAKTLRALNVPVSERIRQLTASLERCQALPPLLERRHVVVNIADFSLKLYEEGRLRLQMPVIVGRPYRQTPVFHSRISSLVLNPSWNVPKSITTRDLLPKVKKNPEYLRQMGFRILRDWKGGAEIDPATIDWASLVPARFPYRLRQDPGPANALGRLKFFFPNPYDVYLHDTPSQELFQQDARAFSSGCIRIGRPLELAAYLLQGTALGTSDALEAAISRGGTRTLGVPRPIAISVVYMTAWVDPEGILHFRPDIYNRDPAL